MKEFLKYTLATIVGILLLGLIIGIFSLLTLSGLASMSSTTEPIASNSVMLINLDGSLDERSVDNPFAELMGSGSESLGLNDLLTAIKSAKENDDIKGIYLKVGSFSGGTPAMLQELRDALVDFKKDGTQQLRILRLPRRGELRTVHAEKLRQHRVCLCARDLRPFSV